MLLPVILQCFNAKCDVLNCWCDLDFESLVFWLSLVWSWEVEVYAWTTIWNFFNLRQPQQPQIKSVKIQMCFCSINFCQTFDKIFFWFWGYMTQNLLGMTAGDLIPARYHCDYASFFSPFEMWIFVFFINYFQKCRKKQKYCWIDQVSCWTACIESYWLRFKRKLI